MKPKFTKAIVNPPGNSLVNGLTTSTLGVPNYELALNQHSAYVNALKEIGLDVIIMEPHEKFPDSTLVEDTVLLTTECAIITRPSAESRLGETAKIIKSISAFTSL